MQVSENMYTDERRQVLLCKGRLSLRVLQELFNLTVIEMKHGTDNLSRLTEVFVLNTVLNNSVCTQERFV